MIMTRLNKNTFKMRCNDVRELFTLDVRKALYVFVAREASSCSSRYTALCAVCFFVYIYPIVSMMGGLLMCTVHHSQSFVIVIMP